MAVWPQTECKTILVKLKFGGGASHHREHCVHVYLEVLIAILSLEILEQSHELEILQEIQLAACWRRASYMYSS